MKRQKAFTLIELLVVIVIIGILATISIATFSGAIEKARLGKAQFAAGQVRKQFLAENAAAGTNLFSGWYGFDRDGDVNTSSPYILDKSEAGNHLVGQGGGGTFSQSDDTGSGSGKSLRLVNKGFSKTGAVPGGAVNKITLATWFKTPSVGATPWRVFPLLLTSSAGFQINVDESIGFYMNNGSNYITSSPSKIKDGTWHYIVGSYNGDTDTMKFWLDGDLVGSALVEQTTPFQGQGIYLGEANFNGFVDESMVFPFAFDGDELN